MINNIWNDVRTVMAGDSTGHDIEHVKRVYDVAMMITQQEKCDAKVVGLAALLHDVDDYKLFGQESADNLLNARKIMQKNNVSQVIQERVCNIIRNMGYSNAIKGIRPDCIEGKIVSDADMLDAIGACGVVRCLTYAIARCETVVFDKDVFPVIDMSSDEYKQPNRKSDNFVNHFFEKLLKLKNMMFTDYAKKEAEVRHKIMVDFLKAFFREQNLSEWLDYLCNYENQNKIIGGEYENFGA